MAAKTTLVEETFEKCSILLKFKEGESATELWRINRRNTWCILRIKLKLPCEQNVELDPPEYFGGDKRGRFAKVSIKRNSYVRDISKTN